MLTEPFSSYAWWLLVNGIMHYLEFDFLLSVTNRSDRKYMLPWLAAGGCFTLLSVYDRIPGMFFFHTLLLLLFAKTALKLSWSSAAAPVAVLFTIYTFLEAFSVLILSYLSSNLNLAKSGTSIQLLLSALLPMLLFFLLLYIKRRYSASLKHPISSCLYLLLLPSTLLILSLRFCLRLDSVGFAEYLSSLGANAAFAILLFIITAFLLFFLLLNTFDKMIALTEESQAAALLSQQLERQKTYIQEAEKRQEQYASFRHDLNNHLLVLTGLLQEESYREAKKYAKRLYKTNRSFLVSIHTGCPALDILLREKVSYAKQNHVEVLWDVRIPEAFHAEPMDLCVIFSNLMDNAIHACMKEPVQNRIVSIATNAKARFLVIEEINPTSLRSPVIPGIGLHNVQALAEKYQGTVEYECQNGSFQIRVLLCSLSQEAFER